MVLVFTLRQVDPAYLSFLRAFDNRVPMKSERPWLWAVPIGEVTYGIPLTTRSSVSGYAGFLRCGAVPENGLYLRYMIPVPETALLPEKPLTPAMARELQDYNGSAAYILEEARLLHRLSAAGKMYSAFQCHSCDFAELESVVNDWRPGFETGLFLYAKEDANMPTSKNGKLFYTKEQYEQAKYNGNALAYAQSKGYDLIRQGGGWYKLREHDSMVFTPDGQFFWNSRGVHGGALDFMVYYEGKTVPEAVLELCGEMDQQQSRTAETSRQAVGKAPEIPKEFQMPQRAGDFRALYGYLIRGRGLTKSVVQEMIAQNRAYQSVVTTRNGTPVNNAAFIYYNDKGEPCGAFQRGMRTDGTPYKRDVYGSDKSYGWMLAAPCGNAAEVRVFEAAIDAASDASLESLANGDGWKEKPVDRLSLEGLGIQPLTTYLRQHPDVGKIVLMLDADTPGRTAAQSIAESLRRDGCRAEIETRHPPFGKDWNDVLVQTRGMQAEQAEQDAQKQDARQTETSSQLETKPEPDYEPEL